MLLMWSWRLRFVLKEVDLQAGQGKGEMAWWMRRMWFVRRPGAVKVLAQVGMGQMGRPEASRAPRREGGMSRFIGGPGRGGGG